MMPLAYRTRRRLISVKDNEFQLKTCVGRLLAKILTALTPVLTAGCAHGRAATGVLLITRRDLFWLIAGFAEQAGVARTSTVKGHVNMLKMTQVAMSWLLPSRHFRYGSQRDSSFDNKIGDFIG